MTAFPGWRPGYDQSGCWERVASGQVPARTLSEAVPFLSQPNAALAFSPRPTSWAHQAGAAPASCQRKYDHQFKIVFKAIKKLLEPLEKPEGRIGFHPHN